MPSAVRTAAGPHTNADNAALLERALDVSRRISAGVTHDLNSALQGIGDTLYAMREDINELGDDAAGADNLGRFRDSLELAEAAYTRLAAAARIVPSLVPPAAEVKTSINLGTDLLDLVMLTSHQWRNRLDISIDVDSGLGQVLCEWWIVRLAVLRMIVLGVEAQQPRRRGAGETVPRFKLKATATDGVVTLSAKCESSHVGSELATSVVTDAVLRACSARLDGDVGELPVAPDWFGVSFTFPAPLVDAFSSEVFE